MFYAVTNNGQTRYIQANDVSDEIKAMTDEEREAIGWSTVLVTEQPTDTETTTHDLSFEVIDGVHTMVWTPREKNNEELIADGIRQQVDTLNALLGTTGVVDTTTLRGLKSMSNADINANSARFMKDLINILIEMLQAEKRTSRNIAKRFESNS